MKIIPEHGVTLGVNSTFERYLIGNRLVFPALVLLLAYSVMDFSYVGEIIMSSPRLHSFFSHFDGVTQRAYNFTDYEYGLGLLSFIFTTTHIFMICSLFYAKPLYVRLGYVRLVLFSLLFCCFTFLFYYLMFNSAPTEVGTIGKEQRFTRKEVILFFGAWLTVLLGYILICWIKSIIFKHKCYDHNTG